MASGIILGSRRKFYWNVDAHVGPGCPNRPDDVQLVQLGYYAMARSTSPEVDPKARLVYMGVTPGAPYSGALTDPLTHAIKTQQALRGGTQDGRVSPIQNASGVYGSQTWMLIPLCNCIYDYFPRAWPLLHKMQGCPGILAGVSETTFTIY